MAGPSSIAPSGMLSGLGAAANSSMARAAAVGGAAWGAGSAIGRAAVNKIAATTGNLLVIIFFCALVVGAHLMDAHFGFNGGGYFWARAIGQLGVLALIAVLFQEGVRPFKTIMAGFFLAFLAAVSSAYIPLDQPLAIFPGLLLVAHGVVGAIGLIALQRVVPRFDFDAMQISIFAFILFGLPYILVNVEMPTVVMVSLMAFTPVWLYYILFIQQSREIPGVLQFLAILTIIILMVPNLAPVLASSGLNYNQEVSFSYTKDLGNKIVDSYTQLWNQTYTLAINGYNGTRTEIRRAQGYEFESQVEKGAIRDAGLSVAAIKLGNKDVYQDRDALYSTTLTAKTFDTDLALTTFCTATGSSRGQNRAVSGETVPTALVISSFDTQSLECRIPAGKLAENTTYTLNLGATFNYVTSARIKRYFITETARSTLKSVDKSFEDSFFDFYKITDRQEISLYTKGPMDLGININPTILTVTNLPKQVQFTVQVGLKDDRRFTGVSGTGTLDKLEQIRIGIPPGFMFKEGKTTDAGTLPDCFAGTLGGNFSYVESIACDPNSLDPCDDYHYVVYQPDLAQKRTAGGQFETLVSCTILAASPDQIIPGGPFALKSFRAQAYYTFNVSSQTSFFTRPPISGKTSLTTEDAATIKTFCDEPYALDFPIAYDYLVSANPTLKTSLVEVNAKLASSTDYTKITSLDCKDQSVYKALILYDWSALKLQPTIEGYRYDLLQLTPGQLAWMFKNAVPLSIDEAAYNALNDNGKQDFMRNNAISLSIAYYDAQYDSCAGDIRCAVGRMRCGVNFKYGDLTSCDNGGLCNLCMQKIIPGVLTLAPQVR